MGAYDLDLKDKKILQELDFDARQTFSQLAKKVGLSKQVVEYRVNNLMKKKILTGFYPVINIPKLGYYYCRLAITLQNISPEEYDGIFDDLNKDKRVFWLFETQGSFELFFGVWMKSLNDFRLFIQKFMEKYSKFVKNKTENVATDVVHYQHRYLLGKKETREIHIAETSKRVEIDDMDRKILELLCENARMSLVDMGTRLKENPKTISYRISRMEKLRLIECYRTKIDHNALGLTYYKIFLNIKNYDSKHLLKLEEFIKSNPASIYFIRGIALHGDIDFEMMIQDNKVLFDFIKSLRKEFPKIIENYNTIIYIGTIKVRYLPF